jgi:hypothetical protein
VHCANSSGPQNLFLETIHDSVRLQKIASILSGRSEHEPLLEIIISGSSSCLEIWNF